MASPPTPSIPLFPPPPVMEPFFDKAGNMSRVWTLWFTAIYEFIQDSEGRGEFLLEA